jgi:hypothetical protein
MPGRRRIMRAAAIGAGILGALCGLLTLLSFAAEHVGLVNYYPRSGWSWHFDFLRGDVRLIVKESDVFIVHWSLPGWLVAAGLAVLAAVSFRIARRADAAPGGFPVSSSRAA